MKKRKKLGRKMTAICGVFVLVLSIALGVLGIFTYYENVRERYEQYVETIIKIADSHIDNADMEQCMETGNRTEKYMRTQEQLNSIKSHSDVEYLYVIQPLNTGEHDNARYVWSAVIEDQNTYRDNSTLGDLSDDDFDSGMAERFTEVMAGEDEVTYYANRTEKYGYMLTGMYPLRNQENRSIALVCADISMNENYHDINQ